MEREVFLYRVIMRDGTEYENLTHEETLPLISGDNEKKWASVHPMEYGKDLDPENAKRRKAWGM
jgi:hypothetical protein